MSIPLGSSLHHNMSHRKGDSVHLDRPASRASRPSTNEITQPRKRSLSLGGFLSRSSGNDNATYPYVEKESRSHRRSSQQPVRDHHSSSSSSTSRSNRVHFEESHPALPPHSTYSPAAHASSLAPPIKLHRTLAYQRQQPPMLYDIVFKPDHTNVLHAQSLQPFSAHTLNLPATLPRVSEMELSCRDLPWRIVVHSATKDPRHAITSLDILSAVHTALRKAITRKEWDALGNGSKTQTRVADTYARRCQHGKDFENGVRRSDFLLGRTMLAGIDARPDGTFELVFGRGQ